MRKLSIETTTYLATRAALRVLDEATEGTTRQSGSPCGDKLAADIHKLIERALREHLEHPDYAPAFIEAAD